VGGLAEADQWVYDVFDLELAHAPRSTYATTYATVEGHPLIAEVSPRGLAESKPRSD
jgi:hypothetical protein